jgi:hypothetical protein
LNRSIGGSESKDEDMGAYVTAAAALAARFQCAVIIIHHCGTNENRPRGHTSLTGAVEAQIGVKRDDAGRIIAAVEYMKDGPEEGQIISKLEVVELGTDEDGEPITISGYSWCWLADSLSRCGRGAVLSNIQGGSRMRPRRPAGGRRSIIAAAAVLLRSLPDLQVRSGLPAGGR